MDTSSAKPLNHININSNDKNNVVFLNDGNPPHKEIINTISIHIENDLNVLSATELSNKYNHEYSSWKNMKQRKKAGAIIDSRFEKFPSFLLHMGRRPTPKYSLDRVDNENPLYSPETCEWRDKYAQNSNKGNNKFLSYKGEILTIAQWAAKTTQKADTLYKRKSNGWSDEEVITGKRITNFKGMKSLPWPSDNIDAWQKKYNRALLQEDTLPLNFYIKACEGKINSYQSLIEDLSADPDFDESTLPAQTSWDLKTYELWVKRLQTARVIATYEKKEAYIQQRLKDKGLTACGPIQFQSTPKPNINELQKLTGGLPKDRPENQSKNHKT